MQSQKRVKRAMKGLTFGEEHIIGMPKNVEASNPEKAYATCGVNFMPRALITFSTVPRLGFPSFDSAL